ASSVRYICALDVSRGRQTGGVQGPGIATMSGAPTATAQGSSRRAILAELGLLENSAASSTGRTRGAGYGARQRRATSGGAPRAWRDLPVVGIPGRAKGVQVGPTGKPEAPPSGCGTLKLMAASPGSESS